MTFVHALTAAGDPPSPALLGAKAHGLITLMALGLPVPPGFVISTDACRHYLLTGHLPEGLAAELAAALTTLESRCGTSVVSVRSGAAVSMPGMMNTLLNVPLREPGTDDDLVVGHRILRAVTEVFDSWNTARATTYRELHDIPHDLGTAVVVQAMVFGDRDSHSGSGVAFSRDPSTGEKGLYGDVLFGRQGEDVVSGRHPTRPLSELAVTEPLIWSGLVEALTLLERHFEDVCHVEFTYESGRLWFLQVRPGGLSGRAAVRAAVDLADEGVTSRETALNRVTPRQLRAAHTTRIRLDGNVEILTRGVGASPGVATGRIAVTADQAARMAALGPVILVRPHTSPLDMHGLAAAAGIVTTVGGPTSHAAVVARSMGKPSVVAAAALSIDPAGGCVRTPALALPVGTVITIDGTGGEVVLGRPESTTGNSDPHLARLLSWAAETIEPIAGYD